MDEFVAGLVVGVLVGILLGPMLRSWLVWHELDASRRRAALTEQILSRMDSFGRPHAGDGPLDEP